MLKSIGMNRMVLGEKNSRSKDLLIKKMDPRKLHKPGEEQVLIGRALSSRGVDLKRNRYYRVLDDRAAKDAGFVRIIDRSGEDYLYPKALFHLVRVPKRQLKYFLTHGY